MFRRPSRRTAAAFLLSASALAAVPTVADAGGRSSNAVYRVTIENVSTGSQPLSPAGVVVHNRKAEVWSVGSPATAAVAAIAEDANLGIFVDTYRQTRGVSQSFVGGDAPFGPGGSSSFEIEARPGSRLSLVSMLVNTNDAFTGLDSVPLGHRTRVYEVGAYDGGTEVNNELASHIPGPAGGNPFVREPEGGVIGAHPGIEGVGDLDPAIYDWDGPVARITIERVG